MLLERGADPNARDFIGRTPLAMLSLNKIKTLFSNGIYGDLMGKTRQLRPQMLNPEHWDEIHRLLLDYGGKELDDYIETIGERKMMEAVVSYIYWLNHLGTAFFGNPVVLNIIQDIGSGTTPMDTKILYGLAMKNVVEHRGIITGYLKSMHTLAEVTEHLPVKSAVLGVSFSAHFKDYLAAWRKPVNWDEVIDFMIAVLRYMQDPKTPESPFPEELTDADLDSVMDEHGNPLRTTGPPSPAELRILGHFMKISIPADCDVALECLTSPFVPELPPGLILSDEASEAFDKVKGFHKSAIENLSARDFADFYHQLTQAFQPANTRPAAGEAERLLDFISANSNSNTTNYKPSFLSDLEPPSLIYICSINTEHPALRKIGFGVPVFGLLLMTFFLLWRMLTWLHWLTINRFTSLLLLYGLQGTVLAFPIVLTDFSYFAIVALVGGWLANDRLWQFVLECSFIKRFLEQLFYNDPYKALIRQISFRWRYGFPEMEPLILSHAQGKEWKYDFAQLLEGLGGSHSSFSTWNGWIHRPDAISTVLDEWQLETVEGLESTTKFWGDGWWYYKEGKWRKFKSVENSRPERYLKMFGDIEVRFSRSSMSLGIGLSVFIGK